MPKLKTNRSVAKRVRVSKNGKLKRNRQGRRHLLSHKTSKQRRRLRKVTLVHSKYVTNLTASLNN